MCDNHPSNVSILKNLLQHFNQDLEELFISFELRKIYLLYDTLHLVNNIQKNLLNYKRFISPLFKFDGFKDPINVAGGEIKFMTFTRKMFFWRQLEKRLKIYLEKDMILY